MSLVSFIYIWIQKCVFDKPQLLSLSAKFGVYLLTLEKVIKNMLEFIFSHALSNHCSWRFDKFQPDNAVRSGSWAIAKIREGAYNALDQALV